MIYNKKELELKLVNEVFGEDFTLENVEDNVMICIDIWGVKEEEYEKLFTALYDMYYEDRVHGVFVFRCENSDGYIITTDSDEIDEQLENNEENCIGSFSYFIEAINPRIIKEYDYLKKYKYVFELSQIE